MTSSVETENFKKRPPAKAFTEVDYGMMQRQGSLSH
jgi:hypothetical protein